MCLCCAVAASAPQDGVRIREDEGPVLWADGGPAGGTLRWTGAAGLRLDLDGTSIAFDPFVTRPSVFGVLCRRPRPAFALVAERFSDLDAVFVGHTHFDHAMDLPAVAAASPRAVIHGSRTTIELCRRLGVASSQLVEVADGDHVGVGPFDVETVASAHGRVRVVGWIDRIELAAEGVPAIPFRYPRGAVYAWRVETDSRAFHVQGSAGIDDDALARLKPVDGLFACLAARRGTPGYLERLGAALRPRILLPLHHDDFFRPVTAPPRPVPGLDWPGFEVDAAAMGERWSTRLFCPPFDQPVSF